MTIESNGTSKPTDEGSHAITVEPAQLVLERQNVALIHADENHVGINDFKGKAIARRNADGTHDYEIDGTQRGRANEYSVFKSLKSALRDVEGAEVDITPGRDDHGEDGIATIGPREFVVQVVTVPADETSGREIASGTFRRLSVTPECEAKWIHDAVVHKSSVPPASRQGIILALDVRHASFVSDQATLDKLNVMEPSIASFGFAQVWLVGPTGRKAVRIDALWSSRQG